MTDEKILKKATQKFNERDELYGFSTNDFYPGEITQRPDLDPEKKKQEGRNSWLVEWKHKKDGSVFFVLYDDNFDLHTGIYTPQDTNATESK